MAQRSTPAPPALRRGRADDLGADAGRRRGHASDAGGLHGRPARDRLQRRLAPRWDRVRRRRDELVAQADQSAAAGCSSRFRRGLLVPDHADPARGLIDRVAHAARLPVVRRARASAFAPGWCSLVGPNGAGKTNLLESLHRRDAGFLAPDARRRATRPIRCRGSACLRRGQRGQVAVATDVVVQRRGGKELQVERRPRRPRRPAAQRDSNTCLHARPSGGGQGSPGGPACLFRSRPHSSPSRPCVSAGCVCRGARTAQRVVSAGSRSDSRTADAVAPWTRSSLRSWARMLVAARQRALELLSVAFAERAGELGLAGASLDYRGEPPSLAGSCSTIRPGSGARLDGTWPTPRRDRDYRRLPGSPQLRVAGRAAPRTCSRCCLPRPIGIADRGEPAPLLLLDDVLSELDTRAARFSLGRSGEVARP